jgi:hypothetical protein
MVRLRSSKFRLLPVLLLTGTVIGCAPGEPQIGGEPLPAEDGSLGVAYDSGSSELVFELGPVDLPAHSDHHHVQQPAVLEGSVPIDGWVHGYHVELVDHDGNPVPKDVLHHVNIIVPGRRELFSQIMQRLGAAGTETADVGVPGIVGYPLNRGDQVLLSAMMHNPTGTSYEGVRVRVRMPHVKRERLVRPIRVFPFYLDVMPPAGIHEYDLPPGHSEKSWEGRPAVSGRILGAGGHLHKYATSLKLEDLTADKVLYETQPILDATGAVTGMAQDLFIWRFGIPIDTEHTYRLTATYENPEPDTIPGGGMGALGGIMIPAAGQEWPTIDPKSAEYMKDRAVTLRMEGGHEGMDMSGMKGMDMGAPKSESHSHEGSQH